MNLTVRPITEDEVPAFRQQLARGFGHDVRDADNDRFSKVFETPRLIAAFDGADMVGSCGAFSFDVTVPGGTLSMGGTTIVTVLPTHRRRGVLRAMMREHLEEIRSHEEPLAGLWASEASIYGRFGYGLTVEACRMTADAKSVAFSDRDTPRCRWLDPADAQNVLPPVYDRVRATRPGMLTRHADWWFYRVIDDPEHRREGASSRRFVVHDGPDGIDGYVILRQKAAWGDFPQGEVKIAELVAATPEAHAALWQFVLCIDLFPKVSYWNLPPDDVLPWRITEHRRVMRTLTDSMWLRLVDIPRALGERVYDVDGRLVIGVTDPFLPDNDGAYALDAGPEGAQCARTSDDADIAMGVDALAAVYLGGQRPSVLARANLVTGDAEAIARADRIFAWPVAPWCAEVF